MHNVLCPRSSASALYVSSDLQVFAHIAALSTLPCCACALRSICLLDTCEHVKCTVSHVNALDGCKRRPATVGTVALLLRKLAAVDAYGVMSAPLLDLSLQVTCIACALNDLFVVHFDWKPENMVLMPCNQTPSGFMVVPVDFVRFTSSDMRCTVHCICRLQCRTVHCIATGVRIAFGAMCRCALAAMCLMRVSSTHLLLQNW